MNLSAYTCAAVVMGMLAGCSCACADVTVQAAQNAFGQARFIGASFGFGSGPNGGPSQTSTPANVVFAASGGSGSTSGGLGDNPGTVQFGSATTSMVLVASPTGFRLRVTGTGVMDAPAGYTGLTIGASLSFFDTAIRVTGSGPMPYSIQRTGALQNVTWRLLPEAGTGASITATTLTPGSYRFDQDDSTPSFNPQYNFGDGGSRQERSFEGEFIVTIGDAPSGVCCRGATCNASVTQANCTPTGLAGAFFNSPVSGGCNAGGSTIGPCCYADYNKLNGVSVQDIFDFLDDWFSGRASAVVGGDGASGTPGVLDIFAFLDAWFRRCEL